MDTPPLVDRLYRILPPGQSEDKLVPLYPSLVMTDGSMGVLLMIGAVLWLGILFGWQISKGEREITFTKPTFILVFAYFVGALMLTKELELVGLLLYLVYATAMVVIGYVLALGTGFLFSPVLRSIIYLYDFAVAVKEETILLLVRDYGFPENARELVLLFAKKNMLRPYLCIAPYLKSLKKFGMHMRAYASYFILVVTDKVKEARKMVA